MVRGAVRPKRGIPPIAQLVVRKSPIAQLVICPLARHNLGMVDFKNDRFERARKHWIIAANLGCDGSLKELKKLYIQGHATKDDYAGALRAYQAALEATKSAEREVAEAFYKLEEAAQRI
jgi:TPR repeat protein